MKDRNFHTSFSQGHNKRTHPFWKNQKKELLKGCMSVLEIVFVGQCEVFVCLDFVYLFFLLGDRVCRTV